MVLLVGGEGPQAINVGAEPVLEVYHGAEKIWPFNAFQAIKALGLTTGLKLCLDAGDAASYTSGQSWLDRSGNGFDFFLGADGSATASDPTFTGTAGDLDAYFAHDGGDYFTYNSANETWMNNLHKNNALFTLAAWVYTVEPAFQTFAGQRGAAAGNTGVSFGISTTQLQFFVLNAGTVVASIVADLVAGTNAWNFFAVSVDEAAGAGGALLQKDNSVEAVTSTYTSPSAGNASFTMQIGARGNGDAPIKSGNRMAMFTAWEGRALTAGEIQAFFNATRGRFGV